MHLDTICALCAGLILSCGLSAAADEPFSPSYRINVIAAIPNAKSAAPNPVLKSSDDPCFHDYGRSFSPYDYPPYHDYWYGQGSMGAPFGHDRRKIMPPRHGMGGPAPLPYTVPSLRMDPASSNIPRPPVPPAPPNLPAFFRR